MFILSLRKKQIIRRLFIISAFAAASAVIIITSHFFVQEKQKYREFGEKKLCLEIYSPDDALNAAGFFGADTGSSSVSCERVRIPLSFNNIYIKYNELQKAFGSDLENYKGKDCLKYSIRSAKNEDDAVTYTLLVCDNRLIGGDISSNDFDGTMTALHKNIDER